MIGYFFRVFIVILIFSGMEFCAYSSLLTSEPDTVSVTLFQGVDSESDLIIKIDSPWADTDYTGYIDYIDEFSKPEIETYDFDDSLELISSGNLQWILRNDPEETLNDTQYAYVASRTDGASITLNSYLTSNKIDLSMLPEPAIEFEQIKTGSTSLVTLQISKDSSVWTDIYSSTQIIGEWSDPEIKSINISREFAVPEVYLRFAAALPRNSGVWAVDNIKIKGNKWLFIEDSLTAAGSVKNWMYEIMNDTVKIDFVPGNLPAGLYHALIRLESPLNNLNIPVNMAVIDQLSIPDVSISILTDSVTLNWTETAGATSYKVYASDDPYSAFNDISEEGSFSGTVWTQTAVDVKKFYYIVAVSE